MVSAGQLTASATASFILIVIPGPTVLFAAGHTRAYGGFRPIWPLTGGEPSSRADTAGSARRSAGDIRARSGCAPMFPPEASAMCRHSASRAAYRAPPDRRRRPRDGRPGAGDPVTCTDM